MASPKLAHLILNTSDYEASKQWYLEVLEATIGVETTDHAACFLRTDDSHHRIGMFRVAEIDVEEHARRPGLPTSPARDRRIIERQLHLPWIRMRA